MLTLRTAALAGLTLWLAGCVPSLQPLFDEHNTVFDSTLLGTWEKDRDLWIFQRADDNAYRVTLKPEQAPAAEFQGRLVQLGAARFLDLSPEETETLNGVYKFHLIPARSISRIWLHPDKLRVAVLDGDWLKGMIRDGKVQIGHEFLPDKTLILTAPTAQLQALVTRYADDPKAFPQPEEYRRVQ